jgi:hypothetical protein
MPEGPPWVGRFGSQATNIKSIWHMAYGLWRIAHGEIVAFDTPVTIRYSVCSGYTRGGRAHEPRH